MGLLRRRGTLNEYEGAGGVTGTKEHTININGNFSSGNVIAQENDATKVASGFMHERVLFELEIESASNSVGYSSIIKANDAGNVAPTAWVSFQPGSYSNEVFYFQYVYNHLGTRYVDGSNTLYLSPIKRFNSQYRGIALNQINSSVEILGSMQYYLTSIPQENELKFVLLYSTGSSYSGTLKGTVNVYVSDDPYCYF